YDAQEYLLFSAIDDQGNNLDEESCRRLFRCSTIADIQPIQIPAGVQNRLAGDSNRHIKATIDRNLEENNHYFRQARKQLNDWARDQELAAEKKLDDIKIKIRDQRRLA